MVVCAVHFFCAFGGGAGAGLLEMSSVSGGAIGKKRKKKSKTHRFDSEFVRQVVPHAREGSAKLRACFKCKLVKTEEQWEDYGCLNCNWDTSDFMEETTQDFSGMIAMCDPTDSWVAKWQNLTKMSVGVYAKSVSGAPLG